MEVRSIIKAQIGTEKQTSLPELPQKLEEQCRGCKTSTPIICVGACKTWKLKNELRRLYEQISSRGYTARLLNTLKNRRRSQILTELSREKQSGSQLQRRLRKLGYYHSQQTILEEYINPLVSAGLVEESRNLYSATFFGCEISVSLQSFQNFEILPPHSECYEETTLEVLRDSPKTFEDLKTVIPAKSLTRVLNRLRRAALVESNAEKDYIFFFKTKREPSLEKLSPTERRVYQNILEQGTPAQKLARNVHISLRRVYKYLRKLKGKKLVFVKKKPMTYRLTAKGEKMEEDLDRIKRLVAEAMIASAHMVQAQHSVGQVGTQNNTSGSEKKEEQVISSTTSLPIRPSKFPNPAEAGSLHPKPESLTSIAFCRKNRRA